MITDLAAIVSPFAWYWGCAYIWQNWMRRGAKYPWLFAYQPAWWALPAKLVYICVLFLLVPWAVAGALHFWQRIAR